MKNPIGAALSLAVVLVLGLNSFAQAEVRAFSIALAPNSAGPAEASGKIWGSYDTDTQELSFKLSWSGLTGPVTTAHFHGPASEGENAGVLIPIEGAYKSGMSVMGKIEESAAKVLLAGKTYVNLHTSANPNGEIRGQVVFADQSGSLPNLGGSAMSADAPGYTY